MFFFRWRPPAPDASHPVDLDVALDELPSASGDRRRVDAEQLGDAPVAAPPALERFEAGEQTPLPLVEQAGEQHDRGAQFLRHQVGLWQGPHESGRGQQQAPRAQLVGLVRTVGRAVEELAGEFVPRQPPVADELAQRVLGADHEQVVQLVDEVSRLGVVDERLGGRDQGAGAGEADPGEGPQAVLVEVGEYVEGVVAAAMRVAGPGVEVLELAKGGAPAGAGPEGRGHLGQRGDSLLAEQGADRVGGECGWSHCGTIMDTCFRNHAISLDRALLSESREPMLLRGWSTPRPSRDRLCSIARLQALLGSYLRRPLSCQGAPESALFRARRRPQHVGVRIGHRRTRASLDGRARSRGQGRKPRDSGGGAKRRALTLASTRARCWSDDAARGSVLSVA